MHPWVVATDVLVCARHCERVLVDQLEKEDSGIARKLEVDKIKPEDIVIFHCDRGATLLLRGSSPELVQELEKTMKRALLILKHSSSNPKVVPEGGAVLVELASQFRRHALTFEGREQFVIGSFADALEKYRNVYRATMAWIPLT